MSRKGYARLEDEMRKASTSADSITIGDVWIRGHTGKSSGFLNEEVANAVVIDKSIPLWFIPLIT
ncbi:PREDICTED: LOC110760861 [Prunus dulcis]|uniref:PREDICTED: LOC110760861 n=1 Tax=Prunus dulcis TaxID=3755 RepID=A0A5E4FSF9_PRUDU|nr:PREDICTED: LOC110760861 [Prunus dulcis]